MRTLFNILIRYHFLLLFILFELISVSIVISSDVEKKNVYFSSANALSGFFTKKINNLSNYFSLTSENQQLANENLKLRSEIVQLKLLQNGVEKTIVDTSSPYYYEYIPAKVIKNSVSNSKNFITIDKGERDGIQKDFGVISPKGVVGVVIATSYRYSLVVSLLNTDWGISGKIKKNGYYGSVKWEGLSYRYINMYEIPNHLKISIGDTIVSSGYSAIFPEGVDIGVISKVDKNVSNNFFDLELELLTDFKNLYHVYIVNNKNRREQILLENTVEDEY